MTTLFFGARWGRTDRGRRHAGADAGRAAVLRLPRADRGRRPRVHPRYDPHGLGVCSCTGHGRDRAAARLVWQRVGERRGRDLAERNG